MNEKKNLIELVVKVQGTTYLHQKAHLNSPGPPFSSAPE